jgi:hypothetical protein
MPPDVPVTLTSLAGEPMVKNLYPLSGSGPTVLATGTFATHAWAPDLYLAYILFLPTPNVVSYTAKGTCLIEYNTISNGVRLIDDPGTGWIGPISGVPLGPLAGTLSNSVCTVNLADMNVLKSPGSIDVIAPVAFKEGFQGVLGTFSTGL